MRCGLARLRSTAAVPGADRLMGLGLRAALASMRLPNAYCGLVPAAADAGIERRARELPSAWACAVLSLVLTGLGSPLAAAAGLTGIMLVFSEGSKIDALGLDARPSGVVFAGATGDAMPAPADRATLWTLSAELLLLAGLAKVAGCCLMAAAGLTPAVVAAVTSLVAVSLDLLAG